MRFGLLVPTLMEFEACGLERLREAAELGDNHGFETLWVPDHLLYSAPILDASATVATLAALTRRVTIGTNVLQLPLRRPVDVAKSFSTISYLSGGRLVLGIGVGGGFADEWRAAGVDVSRRGALCDEAIEALHWYWDGAEQRGTEWLAPGVAMLPAPVGGRVPIWVGGRVDAAVRRAARCDATMSMWVSPRRCVQIRERITQLRGDLDSFTIGLELLAYVDDDVERARRGVRDALARLHLDPDSHEKYTAYGPPERIAEKIAEYEAAGVEHVSMYFPTAGWADSARRLAGEIMPMVGVSQPPDPTSTAQRRTVVATAVPSSP